MKQHIAKILVLSLLVAGLTFFEPAVAAPVDVLNNSQACQGDTAICGNSGAGVFGLLKTIINVLLIAGGIVAVIMIIVGGIEYSVSAGDPAKVKKAKDTVLYSIVGLVVAALGYAIVNFVLAKL